jgi:hypothetical protein
MRGKSMNFSDTYEKELETLILDTLLPVYIKYQKAKGIKFPLEGLNERLLRQVKIDKRVPALLRAKEKLA